MDAYFETRDFSVGYDGRALIRDISIGVHKGEVVALIGPNGCGKSTILKSIARQLKAVSGTVLIEREDIQGLARRDLAKKMAVMLTERVRPELLTCFDVVAAGRYPYTGRLGVLGPGDREKVKQALNAVGALDLMDRDFHLLSDGQRQRVLLARALCQQPQILLLDEPTSYLDIRFKLELLCILRRMARETGMTVLLSLHEIDLAQKLADRVLCVKGDRILEFGAPERVFGEETVRTLYDLREGSYDPLFGSVELPRVTGAPRVLVLSACGSGIPVYRALQREGVAFAAGILYTNDVDYRVARLLAAQVVTEAPFQEIGEAPFQRAQALLRTCECALDAGFAVGACNRRMTQLCEAARAMGKYETASSYLRRMGKA